MLLNQTKSDYLLTLLHRRYPRWSGFSDLKILPRYRGPSPGGLGGYGIAE